MHLERILIWKALLLRKAGKLDEAEELVKKAISIDPSDGEQGKGDRMRVYGVFADILRDRGDAEKEKFFRGVLKAIRLSEDADDYFHAGLYTQAVKMYKNSLQHFADAYCIQSRIAVRLSKAGKHEEAAKFYRRAFELMPDSFGRMESHCFGCEGVFADDQAKTIAEEVFQKHLEERPDKPQNHYLLGYLRQQQNRRDEALVHYRKAVELDPEYINAWIKIYAFRHQGILSSEEHEEMNFRFLKLDPLHRHTSLDLKSVRNLRRLWEETESVIQLRKEPLKELFPLPAVIERRKQVGEDLVRYSSSANQEQQGYTSAAQYLADHQLIENILNLMDLVTVTYHSYGAALEF